ncbi:MAG TPA: hypothetical protein VGX48_10610 [Pyrinomonadaceae bacterium]|jgi:hypothetical protein|nr:hypothetical protein [Pyrinomonadaceae bacterium]
MLERYANHLALASAGIPLLMLGSSAILKALHPEWYCVPVQPGAREFICGGEYLHPGISLYVKSFYVVWGVLLVLSSAAIVRGGGRWFGRLALAFSILFVALLVALWVSLGNHDYP